MAVERDSTTPLPTLCLIMGTQYSHCNNVQHKHLNESVQVCGREKLRVLKVELRNHSESFFHPEHPCFLRH